MRHGGGLVIPAWSIVLLCLPQFLQGKILQTRVIRGLNHVQERVDMDRFDYDAILEMARDRLTGHRDKPLVHVVFCVDRSCEAARSDGHLPYAMSVRSYLWSEANNQGAAEFLRFGDSAAVRFRLADSQRKVVVLAGADPFVIRAQGREYALIYMDIWGHDEEQIAKSDDTRGILDIALLSTTRLLESEAQALWEELNGLFSTGSLTLNLLEFPWTPLLQFPFSPKADPPTPIEEYRRYELITCREFVRYKRTIQTCYPDNGT